MRLPLVKVARTQQERAESTLRTSAGVADTTGILAPDSDRSSSDDLATEDHFMDHDSAGDDGTARWCTSLGCGPSPVLAC